MLGSAERMHGFWLLASTYPALQRPDKPLIAPNTNISAYGCAVDESRLGGGFLRVRA